MASVWKHPKSRYWTACYTLPDGQRVKQSTKLTSRTKALQVANSIEAEARAGMTEAHARKMVSKLFETFGNKRLEGESVSSYFGRWIKRKTPEVEPATARKYKDTTTQFLTFLGARAKADISAITAREIAAFRDSQAERLATSTTNVGIKILRLAFEDAKRAHLIVTNEAANVPVLKGGAGKEKLRRPFTEAEFRRLLAVAGTEWRAMIITALYTGGQRLGDVARLTWGNVDLARREIRLVTRKTQRQQILPMNAPLVACLSDLPASTDPSAPVFPEAVARLGSSKTGGVGTLSNQFRRLLVLAELATPQSHKRAADGGGRSARRSSSELSFHSIRHTATSWMKNRGISGPVVQDIVGHDSVTVSAHYTKIDEASKRAALEALPDLTAPEPAVDVS